MDFNFFNQKNAQNRGKKGGKQTRFGGNIAGAILFFLLITGLYLVVSSNEKVIPEVAISDLAKSVSAGSVKSILVEGDKLTITYQNNDVKTAKKKSVGAFTNTF